MGTSSMNFTLEVVENSRAKLSEVALRERRLISKRGKRRNE